MVDGELFVGTDCDLLNIYAAFCETNDDQD